MRKPIPITSAVAAALLALPGCSNRNDWDDGVTAASDTAVCVNNAGQRVSDDRCDERRVRSGGFGFFYLPRGALLPYYGQSVRDPRFASGSSTPRPGVNYGRAPAATRMTRSQAVSRGGLGSTGRSFGRGGG
uniref:hypothetical protein n=1 Tax=uncultured Sphingomonas sp. TaxID=158754 RepID=UPI0025E12A12|nr:hypothetical protein [uncultured Sphingomonas sp.]